MSPDEILAALAAMEGFLGEALTAAGEHREEMIPLFLDLVERLQEGDLNPATDEDQAACLSVFYLRRMALSLNLPPAHPIAAARSRAS